MVVATRRSLRCDVLDFCSRSAFLNCFDPLLAVFLRLIPLSGSRHNVAVRGLQAPAELFFPVLVDLEGHPSLVRNALCRTADAKHRQHDSHNDSTDEPPCAFHDVTPSEN